MESIPFEQLQSIIDKLQSESDRACAVLAGATLDTLLENLLREAMLIDAPQTLFGGTGALSTFSAKIDLAYSFGLLGKNERIDLHIIRKIRNEFAHAIMHELSFATSAIADRARNLAIPKLFEGGDVLAGENDTPRWRFMLSFGSIASGILSFRLPNITRANAPKEISGPGPLG